jgi:hypothetical protein
MDPKEGVTPEAQTDHQMPNTRWHVQKPTMNTSDVQVMTVVTVRRIPRT